MEPLFLVGFAFWFFSSGAEQMAKAVNKVRNGAIVGPKANAPAGGVWEMPPASLAAAAGVDLEVYSLARMASSEHGSDADAYIVAICWAVRNAAGYVAGKTNITAKLTKRGSSALSGFYGDQATKPIAYASTRFSPYERHVRIAREVLALPKSVDPTGGATNFYSPQAQDKLHAKDPKTWSRDAAAVDADWRRDGLEPVAVAGVAARRLTLYRKAA